SYQKGSTAAALVQEDITSQIEAQFSQEYINRFIIDLSADEYGARIVLSARPIFRADTENLQTEAVVFLNLMGKLLQSFDRRVVIEGHAQAKTVDASRQLSAGWSDALIRFFTRTDKTRSKDFVTLA